MRFKLARFLLLASFGLGAIACSRSSNSAKTANNGPKPDISSFGDFLFEPAPMPALSLATAGSADPIIVPMCHLTVIDKMDVSSNVDGTIRWLGIECKPSEVVDSKDFLPHRGKLYRRLQVGDIVEENQILVLLDDRQSFVEMETAEKIMKAAKNEIKSSEAALRSIREIEKIERKSEAQKASTRRDVSTAETNTAKFEVEHAKTLSSGEQKEGEFERARIKWEQYFLRAAIQGEVAQIVKQAGEGVKAAETVLHLQNTDRLNVEGYLDVQYVRQVKEGSIVSIEPTLLDPPVQQRAFHAGKPVSAIATAMVNSQIWVVTGGEDGVVNVWNPKEDFPKVAWRYRQPVRAIACTRPDAPEQFAITGCDDGQARIYDLKELGKTPLRTLEGQHEGGVQAIAIAPDGLTSVTADERGDIFLWETATGKLKYRFPHEHNSSVSALHFTPQCRVVSVGRDNVALVWKVGNKAAFVDQSFENRTGDVGQLGVSDDGSFMALDQYKDRVNLVELGDGRTIGTLHQVGDSAKFSTLALVSPAIGTEGQRLILTSGTGEGVLQLWRRPGSRGRASELRKLVSDGYAQVTCAAFSPVAKDGCIVVGTKKGDVLVWAMPALEDLNGRYEAKVYHVDGNLESSGKTVRIFAQFDNPKKESGRRLRPGTTATMVIPQK